MTAMPQIFDDVAVAPNPYAAPHVPAGAFSVCQLGSPIVQGSEKPTGWIRLIGDGAGMLAFGGQPQPANIVSNPNSQGATYSLGLTIGTTACAGVAVGGGGTTFSSAACSGSVWRSSQTIVGDGVTILGMVSAGTAVMRAIANLEIGTVETPSILESRPLERWRWSAHLWDQFNPPELDIAQFGDQLDLATGKLEHLFLQAHAATAYDVDWTIQQIDASASSDSVDEEYRERARLAADQAIKVVQKNNLRGRPRVMMSDDGVLTLQWRNETIGAALIFTGDNTVSVAIKNAKQLYSDSAQDDLDIENPLPQDSLQTIGAITT
jgi:hypothetical protein